MRFPADRQFVFDVAIDGKEPEVSAGTNACTRQKQNGGGFLM